MKLKINIMKNLFLILAFAFVAFAAKSQTINGTDILSYDSEYLEVIITKKLVKNKVEFWIDLGQNTDKFKGETPIVKDRDRKIVVFSGPVNVLNFFEPLGYQYVDRIVSNPSNMVITSILLKRKK